MAVTDASRTSAPTEEGHGLARRPTARRACVRGPDRVIVGVFFLVPLVLVVRMSLSNWPLLTGDPGLNFPKNYTSHPTTTLFGRRSSSPSSTRSSSPSLLIGLGLGLALLVQERGRWSGFLRTGFLLPGRVGLATASLLFWGFYSPAIGPINPTLERSG